MVLFLLPERGKCQMTEREKYADIIEGNQNTLLTYMSDRSETARVYAAIAYARGASCEEQIEYIKKGNSDINEVIVEHTKYPDVRLSALKYNPSDRTVSGVLRNKEKECID